MSNNRNRSKKNMHKKTKQPYKDISNCTTITITNNKLFENRNNDVLTNLILSLDERAYKQSITEPIDIKKAIRLYDRQYIYNGLNAHEPLWATVKIPAQQIIKEKVQLDADIHNLQDLLDLLDENPKMENVEYSTNINALHDIREPLNKLHQMIGMEKLKKDIIDQIIYYSQGLHVNNTHDYMHTVIYGPPGTGKTELAKIIGKIFSGLGILSNKSFKKVTRSDLIAGYLGQTAIKTTNVIQSSLGGVLFIDEAYALGNSEKKDSFSKECIDTLCEALSDKKKELMVIIAGYENELKECFFSYNSGLESRFAWRYKTDAYSGEDLKNIFIKLIKDSGWECNKKTILGSWFEARLVYFSNFGRDMECLLTKTKIAHSRRLFCSRIPLIKKCIDDVDLDNGYNIYMNNIENNKKSMPLSIFNMYV